MLAKCPTTAQLPFLQHPSFYLDQEQEQEYAEDLSAKDRDALDETLLELQQRRESELQQQQRNHFNLLSSNYFEPLFLTIELCNDIKIDTIVLSNNEYFSSTFRHFSLWVSTNYPPKQPQQTTTEEEFKSWILKEQAAKAKKENDLLESEGGPPRESHSLSDGNVLFKNGWKLIGFFEALNVRGPQVSNLLFL